MKVRVRVRVRRDRGVGAREGSSRGEGVELVIREDIKEGEYLVRVTVGVGMSRGEGIELVVGGDVND